MDVKKFYDSTAAIYDIRHQSPATMELRRKEQSLIRKFQKGITIDFGCGTGAHLEPKIIGIDISKKMLKEAVKRSPRCIQADESLPIKSESVDTILCLFTVLNMVDTSIGKEFFRIVRPGGRVLLSVASVHDNEGKKEKTVRIYGSKLRLQLFTKKQIQEMFSQFSFEHFDSLFRSFSPQWGNFRKFSFFDRITLFLGRLRKKESGAIYLLVFRKPF